MYACYGLQFKENVADIMDSFDANLERLQINNNIEGTVKSFGSKTNDFNGKRGKYQREFEKGPNRGQVTCGLRILLSLEYASLYRNDSSDEESAHIRKASSMSLRKLRKTLNGCYNINI
jgi:hypothetical protein